MQNPEYALFYSPGASSLAPHIVLEELGLAYTPFRVALREGDNRRPEYLAINPRGRVPALRIVDDAGARVLTETMAIMVFLAQRHRDPRLLPEALEALVRALEWMSWLGGTMHQAGARMVFRPESFTVDAAGAEGIAAQGRLNLRAGYADIESRLQDRRWGLGEDYSIVDAYLLVFFLWGLRFGVDLRSECPQYTRLAEAVASRPAAQRALQREGLQLS